MPSKGADVFSFSTLLTLDHADSRDSRATLLLVAASGWLLFLAAALLNPGIIAMDDYFDGIARFVPAQGHAPAEIIAGAGIRSPLPMLLPYGLARLALSFGITAPRAQFHFTLAVLASFAFLVLFLSAIGHFSRETADGPRRRLVAGFLLSFYFLCPLFLSRAMIEALSAPWLLASSCAACAYWARPNRGALLLALVCLGAASLMRFQLGICALALLGVVALRGRWRDFLFAVGLLGVGFVLTGALDWALRGEFHASLKAYVRYNLHSSSEYGVMAWYVFPALFVALAFPPFLVSRYRGFRAFAAYGPLVPAILYFLVFVTAHTIVPHKEERFMLPVVPIFLVLLTPLAAYFLARARAGDRSAKWRVRAFMVVNGVLLVLTTFFPPQKTAVDLAAFAQRNPNVSALLMEEFVLFPQAFVERPIALKGMDAASEATCSTIAAVFSPGPIPSAIEGAHWTRVARFEPGPLEKLVYRLNPRRNGRRRTIEVYAPPGCSYSASESPFG